MESEHWDVGTFVRNWRGMQGALHRLRNVLMEAFSADRQPSYLLGNLVMYDNALCYAIEIAVKTMLALDGKTIPEIRDYQHDIPQAYRDVDEETRQYLQSFWRAIPPQAEILSSTIQEAFDRMGNLSVPLRYGVWTGRPSYLESEALWLFATISQSVTHRYTIGLCHHLGWMRPVAIGADTGDHDWNAGETAILVYLDSPVGTVGPFWLDMSWDVKDRLRPYHVGPMPAWGNRAQ